MKESQDVRGGLESVRTALDSLFDTLTEPYQTLARSDPDAVIGRPAGSLRYASPVSLRDLAQEIEGHGRSAWALQQVEERESQIQGLLRDFGNGLYAGTTAFDWLQMISKFREAVLTDVNTALQAPKTPAQIRLSDPGGEKNGFDKDLLTPQDVAPELGIAARTVRRRIQDGQLGPWRKEGRHWVISRAAFLGYWDQLASDSDLPRPP